MARAPTPVKIIAGFKLRAKIGQGAMGAVFKAKQVSLDRTVALKVLLPRIAKKNPVFVERFIREARSAAKFNHPNIVQGIDVGKDEVTGLYYFAMEYIDGPSAKQILKKEGKIEEVRALTIAQGIAEALVCAHKAGIVHRDIKPDNILLTARGEVKLADLGLAKMVAEVEETSESDDDTTEDPLNILGLAPDAALTQAGATMGTPHYMAPEQVRGKSEQLDIRTDLYALGATLYHMLTGQVPYTGKLTPEGKTTLQEIMKARLTDPVPDACKANPSLHSATGKLISKLMQKEPAKRIQTPAELVKDIGALLEDIKGAKAAGSGAEATLSHRKKFMRPGASTVLAKAVSFAVAAGVLAMVSTWGWQFIDRWTTPPTGERPATSLPSDIDGKPAPEENKVQTATAPPLPSAPPAESEKAPTDPPAKIDREAAEAWAGSLDKADFTGARAALKAFEKRRKVKESLRTRLGTALNEAIEKRANELGKQAQTLAREGTFDAALKLIDSAKYTSAEDAKAQAVLTAERKSIEDQRAKAAEAQTAAAKIEFDGLLKDLEKLLGAGSFEDAAKLLDGARQRPQLAAFADALGREREALEWPAKTRGLVEQGAQKLLDGRAFTLKDPDGKALPVGTGSTLKVVEAGKNLLRIKATELDTDRFYPIPFNSQPSETRFQLALLTMEWNAPAAAELKAQWSYLDLIAELAREPKPAAVRLAETRLAEARKEGARERTLATVQAWLERAEARLPEEAWAETSPAEPANEPKSADVPSPENPEPKTAAKRPELAVEKDDRFRWIQTSNLKNSPRLNIEDMVLTKGEQQLSLMRIVIFETSTSSKSGRPEKLSIPLDQPYASKVALGAAPPALLSEGDGPMTVEGKNYPCHWVVYKLEPEKHALPGSRKIWFSPEIPMSGIVQIVDSVNGVTTTTRLESFKSKQASGPEWKPAAAPAPPPRDVRFTLVHARVGDWAEWEQESWLSSGANITIKETVRKFEGQKAIVANEKRMPGRPSSAAELTAPLDKPHTPNFANIDPSSQLIQLNEGDETLTQINQEFPCHWTRFKSAEGTIERKIWRCAKVPLGGIVKVEDTVSGRKATILLTDFGRVQTAPATPEVGAGQEKGE